jgi:hypothetical protein
MVNTPGNHDFPESLASGSHASPEVIRPGSRSRMRITLRIFEYIRNHFQARLLRREEVVLKKKFKTKKSRDTVLLIPEPQCGVLHSLEKTKLALE